jgi:Arc/MetJ-type ribon-helix-helix transcriptional regulator
MRNILNISVPATLKKEIEHETKTGGYVSVSEFFRAVMRERAENRLIEDIRVSRREIAAGKGKVLRSLRDLR